MSVLAVRFALPGAFRLVNADCRLVLPRFAPGAFDSVVTDPPYELDFMGKSWDRSGVAFDPATWGAVLNALKPGGYMLCFGGTRTYHRLACAVEDAGFEIRDCLMWLYGTGFPKGKGTLKPAWEPILLARKPGKRVLPLGIDACRVPTDEKLGGGAEKETRPDQKTNEGWTRPWMSDPAAQAAHAERVRANVAKAESLGRYPANVVHDGSDEVMEAFEAFGEKTTHATGPGGTTRGGRGNAFGEYAGNESPRVYGTETGTAARFFYCAKASKAERGKGNTHPCVKPLALMRWLVKLVTPEGGCLLDPFAGSGTTGKAAGLEGRRFVGVESDTKHGYFATASRRTTEGFNQ
jgi:hypothetical protein